MNQAVQSMVALKVKQNINISYDSSDEYTTMDDDSVEATLPTVWNILLNNTQEKFGIYPLGYITK